MLLWQRLLSFWLVISRLLARNCCSLAAVVSATVASLQYGRVEKSSFHGCYRLGTPGGWIGTFQSRSFVRSWFLGRGSDEAPFSEEKVLFSEKGGGIQWKGGLVRISTGKAIQWRGPGHSVNRRTPKIEKLLSKSTSQKSAPIGGCCSFMGCLGFPQVFDEAFAIIFQFSWRKGWNRAPAS